MSPAGDEATGNATAATPSAPGARIVLATCAAHPSLTASDQRLAEALAERGARVSASPWNQIRLGAPPADLICLRSTWDYHRRVAEFRAWVEGLGTRRALLCNPPPTVLWNLDKIYLRELREAGIALPPTRWFEPGVRPDLGRECALLPAQEWILKSRVAATAFGTQRIGRGAQLEAPQWLALEAHGCLLQSFMPEIVDRGELSLIYLGGRFSHAVRKRAAAGEYRVQAEYGGTAAACRPGRPAQALAEAVLAALGHAWVYARVDVLECAAGPLLMELELIEPELYLDQCAAAPAQFASALLAQIARG